MSHGTIVAKLTLPYECLRTCHEGASEVRLYRNDLTGAQRIGKRKSAFGSELSVALTEARLLEEIDHPNVVTVHEVASVSDTGYDDPMLRMFEIVMPFFERGSVYDALMRGVEFSVLQACECTEAALRGLAELHRRRILHRDVKPGNVFLASDGSILKVGDLGIAQPMGDDGLAEAHPYPQLYSPPETFTLQRVGVAGDLYGVGLILHEFLNGRFDYDSYGREEFSGRLRRGRPGPRKTDMKMAPHVAPRLRSIIRKATDPHPAKRYASCLEMSTAISRAPFIDWEPVRGDENTKIWEGVSARHRDRRFRIVAERKRSGWKASAEKFVTRWQRFLPVVAAESYDGRAIAELFDQVLSSTAT